MNTAVFVGPSLDQETAVEHLAATYLPPIRRGDLPAVVSRGARAVGIIDGEFNQSLAVSVMEIRAALNQGVRIWGASSMGALRAVECRSLGMKGVGWIYERYEDGTLTADDEVALVFDPCSGRPLSIPLVNVRWAIELAGIGEAQPLLEIAHAVSYVERTAKALLAAAQDGRYAAAMRHLVDFMNSNPVQCDRKRLDALLLLECLCHSA